MFFVWLNVVIIVGLIVFKLYMNYRIERNMKRYLRYLKHKQNKERIYENTFTYSYSCSK